MDLLLVITLLVLPVEVAFHADYLARDNNVTLDDDEQFDTTSTAHIFWSVINYTVDFLFLLDVCVNFQTGYVHPATEKVYTCVTGYVYRAVYLIINEFFSAY